MRKISGFTGIFLLLPGCFLPARLTAQQIGFHAGIMHARYAGIFGEPEAYSAARGRGMNPSVGISIKDCRNRGSNLGLTFTYQSIRDRISESYSHRDCGFSAVTNVRRHHLNIQYDFLRLSKPDRRFSWHLGVMIPVMLSERTSGRYHDYCPRPNFYRDTVYEYSHDRYQLNRPLGFGFVGSFHARLIQHEKWKIGLRGSMYLGIMSDYSAYSSLTPVRMTLEAYAAWQFLSVQELQKHHLQIKSDRLMRRQLKADRKRSRREYFNTRAPLEHAEISAIVNLYSLLFPFSLQPGYSSPGFGFGFKLWKLRGHPFFPGISVAFQQCKNNFDLYAVGPVIARFEGQIQRNVISLSVYPLQAESANKKWDIHLGLNADFVVFKKLSGPYVYQDPSHGIYRNTFLNRDEYHFHRNFSIGPIASLGFKVLQINDHALRARYTLGVQFSDMNIHGYRGNGVRQQFELGYGWNIRK